MKYLQSLITLIIVIFCSGTLVTSCMESSKKIASVHENVKAAKEKFNENTHSNRMSASDKIVSVSSNKKQNRLRAFSYSL